jgi:hypothetical protein
MRMHSRLLHGALQKEETRAIVIEVEDDPEEPGEDEEFYAANFEILGHEDEDEGEEMISEDEGNMTRSRRRTSIWVRTGLACVSSRSHWRLTGTSDSSTHCTTGKPRIPW